jgi:mRNA interferase RelE/StbE
MPMRASSSRGPRENAGVRYDAPAVAAREAKYPILQCDMLVILIAKRDTSLMKTVRYATDAMNALLKHRNQSQAIMRKVARYAETGAGDVTRLVGSTALRLRVGDFRVIFEESETEILVTRIGPRGSVYE